MRKARPWHWFVLYVPFGVTGGFVGVTLGYIAGRLGMSEVVVASIVGMTLLPQTFKFLWAPIADTTLDRKKWYVLSSVVLAGTILPMAFIDFNEANVGIFKVLIFVNAVASSFLGMAVEGLMAHATSEEERGNASGWFQAGNLGGYSIGGGLALLVAENVSLSASFLTVVALVLLCNSGLFLVPNAPREKVDAEGLRKIAVSLKNVIVDLVKTLFLTRRGIIAIILCFTPLCAGAAANLMANIGPKWTASTETVAIVTGIVGGLVSMVGCLGGGWMSDRMNRQIAYVVAGLILAAVAALMGICPRTEITYTIFVLAYQFASGLVYGSFTGFVLEAIGGGAVATKYNVLASLSNIPILYMTWVNGWVAANHGAPTMLLGEAAAGMAGAVVIALAIAILRPYKSPPPAVSSSP